VWVSLPDECSPVPGFVADHSGVEPQLRNRLRIDALKSGRSVKVYQELVSVLGDYMLGHSEELVPLEYRLRTEGNALRLTKLVESSPASVANYG
jgi:hypothetical protein